MSPRPHWVGLYLCSRVSALTRAHCAVRVLHLHNNYVVCASSGMNPRSHWADLYPWPHVLKLQLPLLLRFSNTPGTLGCPGRTPALPPLVGLDHIWLVYIFALSFRRYPGHIGLFGSCAFSTISGWFMFGLITWSRYMSLRFSTTPGTLGCPGRSPAYPHLVGLSLEPTMSPRPHWVGRVTG